MTTIRKILNAFSMVFTVLSVVLGAFFVFTSFQKLSLYRVPIILNIISILVAFRFIFLITAVIVPVYDSLKKIVQKTVVAVSVGIVILCTVFACNAYSGYNSFRQSANISVLNENRTADSEIINYLPFYDYFYEDAGGDTYYAVVSESTNRCAQVTVSNKSGEYEGSPTYAVYYFNSKNKALLLKFVLEEYFNDFKAGKFERIAEGDNTVAENGSGIKFYENESGYSAVAKNSGYICYFKLSEIDKNDISFEDFFESVVKQTGLIDELSGFENVPGAQYAYSAKDN